ncbi:MAG: 50S ribosomal protein L17 [Syntrophorhabdales bacterium]|jgi:large subunit ribosomal protein L17
MRHQKTGRKLNRTSSHRKALFRNLAAALFQHESIKTTNPKALELRKVADRLITLAKAGTLHATRLAFAYLRDKEVVKKLFTDIGARYTDTSGGYTRVLKVGPRKGDAAPMAIIELTQKKEQEKEEKKEEQAKGKKRPAKEKKERKSKDKTEPAKEKKERKPKEKKEEKEGKEKEGKPKEKTEKKGRKAKEEKKD